MGDGLLKGALLVAAVALVVLKLMGEIDWSWIVVFAPLWIPALVSLGLRIAAVGVVAAGVYLFLTGGALDDLVGVLEAIPVVRWLPWEALLS